TTTPWTSGGHAHFRPGGPSLPELFADFAGLLRWERTLSDTRHVGFGDANHSIDARWSDTSADTGPAGRGTGTRDIGIAAMIKVQQCSLRPFEEDILAIADCLKDQLG